MSSLRVGVCLPQFTEDATVCLDAAVEAESLGYAAVSLFDHLRPLGGPPDRPILESFTTLTAVATRTSRVTLLPLVARAGLRPPAVLGHMVQSLDRLARGRFVLGIGAGDASSIVEDRSIGMPEVDQPARRELVRISVGEVRRRAPGVAIWVGGNSAATQRLAGEIADGWNCWAATVDEVRTGAEHVAATAAGAGREAPRTTWGGHVVIAESRAAAAERLATWSGGRGASENERAIHGDPDDVVAKFRALADAGVSDCLLSFVGGEAATQRRLLARTVLPAIG